MIAAREGAVEGLYATGHWLLGQNRFADAACVFRTMTFVRPSDERGWLALGACHEGIGQLGIASELYQLAMQVAVPAPRCTIARGRCLRALGNEDAAHEAFDLAIETASELGDDSLVRLAQIERQS